MSTILHERLKKTCQQRERGSKYSKFSQRSFMDDHKRGRYALRFGDINWDACRLYLGAS